MSASEETHRAAIIAQKGKTIEDQLLRANPFNAHILSKYVRLNKKKANTHQTCAQKGAIQYFVQQRMAPHTQLRAREFMFSLIFRN